MAKIRNFMDQDLSNKVVLLRTDFNVPTQNNKIVDFTRINESIPTIKALIEKKATILIVTLLSFCDRIVGPVTVSAILTSNLS